MCDGARRCAAVSRVPESHLRSRGDASSRPLSRSRSVLLSLGSWLSWSSPQSMLKKEKRRRWMRKTL